MRAKQRPAGAERVDDVCGMELPGVGGASRSPGLCSPRGLRPSKSVAVQNKAIQHATRNRLHSRSPHASAGHALVQLASAVSKQAGCPSMTTDRRPGRGTSGHFTANNNRPQISALDPPWNAGLAPARGVALSHLRGNPPMAINTFCNAFMAHGTCLFPHLHRMTPRSSSKRSDFVTPIPVVPAYKRQRPVFQQCGGVAAEE